MCNAVVLTLNFINVIVEFIVGLTATIHTQNNEQQTSDRMLPEADGFR